MARIIGIREVVSDLVHCPSGFHVEVWSELDGEDVRVWTTEYLTSNSWTANHPESERELTGEINDIRWRAKQDGESVSMTEAVRQAVATVWNLAPASSTEVSGIKRIRKTGGSLVVSITDMADLIGADVGDAVKVTISFVN